MRIIVRADATPLIGTGHVMRCLALAQAAAAAGHRVTFAAVGLPDGVAGRLAAGGFGVATLAADAGSRADADATLALARREGAEWAVVDGYHFRPAFIDALVDAGIGVLHLDDEGHEERYPASVVLNQNAYATPAMYAGRLREDQVLAGPRFTLLRQEFWPWRERVKDVNTDGRRVVVTMGGADPANLTERAVRALAPAVRDGRVELEVVLGSASAHASAVAAAIAEVAPRAVLRRDVDDMPGVLAGADVGVISAGSTAWEAAFLGLPTVMIAALDHQRGVLAVAAERGVALDAGTPDSGLEGRIDDLTLALIGDPGRRREMSRAGRRLIDGQGQDRVLAALAARAAHTEDADRRSAQ